MQRCKKIKGQKDDDLPKISYRNRNNLRISRVTNIDEPRVPPLPDVMMNEFDEPKSGDEQTAHKAKNKRHFIRGTQMLLNSPGMSNNENSYVDQRLKCKAMKSKKRRKRMSVEMIRNKSNDILGKLFAVNRSSDSDCVYLGQDSPGKKYVPIDRKSSIESELSDDSDFHAERCSSHKKMKHTDKREINRKDEFDYRKRKHKTKKREPMICDDSDSNTPEKVCMDSVECKKRLKYSVEESKIKQFTDSDALTEVKESNTPVKVGMNSTECKKRLKYFSAFTKEEIFNCGPVTKLKDTKHKVICPKTLKEKSTVQVKQNPTKAHGILDFLSTLKLRKQTQIELTQNSLKQCYVLLSKPLKHDNVIAECNSKQTTPLKNVHDDSKTVKSLCLEKMQIVPNVNPPLHDIPESNIITKSFLNECHNPLQKHNIELYELDPPAQIDNESVKTDVNPVVKNFETQNKELNLTPQRDEELVTDHIIEDNILFGRKIQFKNTERHFLDIFPRENDIVSESNTEDDPTWTGDSSLNYTLRSSEYSDISDTDDDKPKDITPVSKALPMFGKYRHVFSSVYSDISEESDSEMTVKVFSRCSSPLIDNQKDEVSNFKRNKDVKDSKEGEKQSSVKQMEWFIDSVSSSEGFSDDDDLEEDVHVESDTSEQSFYENYLKFEASSRADRDTVTLTYLNENSLIRDAFITLQAEAVDTVNIVPMEEETMLYLDGFPKLENPFQNTENDKSLEHPIIYIDVDEESDFDCRFNAEQHENLQDEQKKLDTASGMKEVAQNCGDNSKLKGIDFFMNLSLEAETNNKKNNTCGSFLEEKNCFSNSTDYPDSSLRCQNNESFVDEVVLGLNKSETISEICGDKSLELPDIQSKDLKPLSYTQKGYNSDSPNSTMPKLSAISSYSEDHSPLNTTISCDKSASLQLIASSYASPVMTLLTPLMPVLTPVMMVTSSKPRRRKVRCKSTTQPASKHINFDSPNEFFSSHVIKKLSICAKDLDLSHFQLKGYVISDTKRHKTRLPQSKESLLDLCLDDALMIGDTFFELLLHLQDQFEIPCYTMEFLIQSLWLNAGTCLRQINSSRNILKKIAVCDNLTIALSWHQINVSIEHMFSDLAEFSAKEILQVEYYLELVMDVLKNDIYRRNSDTLEIRQSRAYQLLSQNSYLNIPRIVTNYINQALNMIENGTTTATFRSKLMKLLHWLQDLLALTVDISSCCKDQAVALAIKLKCIYTSLPNLASKKLLLNSIQSELLLFCLTELILECEFDDTQPLCDFSLNDVMSSFCQAVPQICMRSPKITPEKTNSSASSTSYSRYTPEQIEEMAMLQYLVTKSYLQVAKGKFDKPLHWRSGEDSLGYYDVEILQKEWSGYMNDVQKHIHSLTSELSWRTTQYLMMMECLGNCV